MKRLAYRVLPIGVPVLLLLTLSSAVGTAPAAKATAITPRTLVVDKGPIHAFAQDANAMAWIDAGYGVHVRRLAAKRGSIVGNALEYGGYKHRGWPLALAGTRALWTSYDAGNFLYTHLHIGSPTRPDHVIYEFVVEFGSVDGDYLGGLAGQGATLVFGATNQRCDNEFDCRRIDVTGAVKRVGAGLDDVPGLPAPVMVATSSGRIALVPAKTPRFYPDIGPPRAAEYAPVEVYDPAGHLISSVVPDGTARAIALSWPKLAVLFEFVNGRRQIQLYDARTGEIWAAGGEGVFTRVPVTVSRISVGALGTVFSVGNRIYLLRRQRPRLVWRAAGRPIGLSVEGRRIAWAVNRNGRGRIVALTLR